MRQLEDQTSDSDKDVSCIGLKPYCLSFLCSIQCLLTLLCHLFLLILLLLFLMFLLPAPDFWLLIQLSLPLLYRFRSQSREFISRMRLLRGQAGGARR